MDRDNRPDRSMDLLNQILEHPVDPDYAEVAARLPARARMRFGVLAVTIVCGAMFAVSGIQTVQSAPLRQTERGELIRQIEDQQSHQDDLDAKIGSATAEVQALQSRSLGNDADAKRLRAQIAEAEADAAAVPVTGPGLVVIASDGPESQDQDQAARVVDLDLQQLVNGLWRAGAEAVAVNGYRMSSRTAIRGAGDAITVDYRSLIGPYRVEAIGDPEDLEAGFQAGEGGRWWAYLRSNFGMGLELRQSKELRLAADPGQSLRYAKGRQ